MRFASTRFALAATVSLIAFSSPAFAAYGYQAQQMPAFQAQVVQAQPAGSTYVAAGMGQQQYANNYQVPAVPDYLPVTKAAAQYTPGMYGGVQQVAYVQNPPAQPVLMAAEPNYAPPQPASSYYAEPNYNSASASSSYASPQQQVMQQPAPQPVYPTYQQQTAQASPAYQTIDAPQPSRAEPSYAFDNNWRRTGFYMGIRSGMTFNDDTSFGTVAGTYTQDYKTGWLLGGLAGYSFKPLTRYLAPRAEIESGTFHSSVDQQTIGITSFKDPNAFGQLDTTYVFVSGYLDLANLMRSLTPYVGGGAGIGIADFDRHGVLGVVMSDSDIEFAWHADAGVAFNVGPGSVIDVGYRFTQVPDVELTAIDGTKSKTDVDSHALLLGFRQDF